MIIVLWVARFFKVNQIMDILFSHSLPAAHGKHYVHPESFVGS